jgi:prophage tail gpP-like protein
MHVCNGLLLLNDIGGNTAVSTSSNKEGSNVYSGITSLSLDLSSSGLKKKRSSQSIKSSSRSRRSSIANANTGNDSGSIIAPTIPIKSLLHHMDDISVSSDANNSDHNKQQHQLLALDVGVSDTR